MINETLGDSMCLIDHEADRWFDGVDGHSPGPGLWELISQVMVAK